MKRQLVFLMGWFLFFFLVFFFIYLFFKFYFNFTILYWFCHISKWICHRYTFVPHPEPSSLLPPHTIPLGRPSAPAPSIQGWFLMRYFFHSLWRRGSPAKWQKRCNLQLYWQGLNHAPTTLHALWPSVSYKASPSLFSHWKNWVN